MNAIILLIYFSKAFDSINHKFIQSILRMYGFGPTILNWIKTLFSNRDARVLMRGEFTGKILLGQGVPQGDIISPYIFILAIEVLLIKIIYTKNIKGIRYAKTDSRNEAFADDATVFMEGEEEYLQAALNYLDIFSKISGLTCNLDKTKVMPLGSFDINSQVC